MIKTYDLIVERIEDSGWFYIRCKGIKGLQSFGPDIEDCLNDILIAAIHLLKDRGQNVIASVDHHNKVLRVSPLNR